MRSSTIRSSTTRSSQILIAAAALLAASPAVALDFRGLGASGDAGRFSAHARMARLDLDNPGIRHGHDSRDQAKNNLHQLIVYYNAAIKKDPKDDDAYFHRGIAKFFAGAVGPARGDIVQANKLDPKYPYYPLWIDIIDKRASAPSELPQAMSQVDMTKWPAPVIQMFLGQSTPAAVLAAANDPDPKTKLGQICEANFYSGELALQQGNKGEAARLFNIAAKSCPSEFVEGPAAKDELEALDLDE
jgi:lipoprotein NlpI